MDQAVAAGRRQTVTLAGEDFSYLTWGDDPNLPVLVFHHATGFNAQTYTQLLAPLANRFRIFALDGRGHGLTPARAVVDEFVSWDQYGADLGHFLDFIGEPAFLSGHSMGGAVSVHAAATWPEKVRGLMLVEPVVMPLKLWRRYRLMRALGLDRILRRNNYMVTDALRRRSVFDSRDAMFNRYQGRGAFTTWPDAMLRDYIAGGTRDREDGTVELSCHPTWEAQTFANAGKYAFWRKLAKVTCPLHILYAEAESTFARAGVVDMARTRKPDADIRMIPGSTHFLPMEFPDIVRDTLLSLLAE